VEGVEGVEGLLIVWKKINKCFPLFTRRVFIYFCGGDFGDPPPSTLHTCVLEYFIDFSDSLDVF